MSDYQVHDIVLLEGTSISPFIITKVRPNGDCEGVHLTGKGKRKLAKPDVFASKIGVADPESPFLTGKMQARTTPAESSADEIAEWRAHCLHNAMWARDMTLHPKWAHLATLNPGDPIMLGDKEMTLVCVRPKATKYPVIAQRATGGRYKFSIAEICIPDDTMRQMTETVERANDARQAEFALASQKTAIEDCRQNLRHGRETA